MLNLETQLASVLNAGSARQKTHTFDNFSNLPEIGGMVNGLTRTCDGGAVSPWGVVRALSFELCVCVCVCVCVRVCVE